MEIKFRMWDGEKFVNPSISYTDGKWFYFGNVFELHEKGIILQQYTGMKDKNGKEIYEGDILIDYVKDKATLTEDIIKFLSKEVVWVAPSFYLIDPKTTEGVKHSLQRTQFAEIIGNIFEGSTTKVKNDEI